MRAEKIGRKWNSPVLSVPENSDRDVDSVLGNKNSDRFQRSLSSILNWPKGPCPSLLLPFGSDGRLRMRTPGQK